MAKAARIHAEGDTETLLLEDMEVAPPGAREVYRIGRKSMSTLLVALTMMGIAAAPAAAQTTGATTSPAATVSEQVKPQMVKKRVCEQLDEDPYSRLGNRKICKTIEVPAGQPRSSSISTQAPATTAQQDKSGI